MLPEDQYDSDLDDQNVEFEVDTSPEELVYYDDSDNYDMEDAEEFDIDPEDDGVEMEDIDDDDTEYYGNRTLGYDLQQRMQQRDDNSTSDDSDNENSSQGNSEEPDVEQQCLTTTQSCLQLLQSEPIDWDMYYECYNTAIMTDQ